MATERKDRDAKPDNGATPAPPPNIGQYVWPQCGSDLPSEDDWKILQEAEDLQRFICKRTHTTFRMLRDAIKTGYATTYDPSPLTDDLLSQRRLVAKQSLGFLRQLRAVIQGEKDISSFEEKILVQSVWDCAPHLRQWLESLAWVRMAERGYKQEFCVNNQQGALDAILAIAKCEMSTETYARLVAPKTLEHLKESVGYRGRFVPTEGRRSSSAPRWLEPLFIAALETGLIPGEIQNPGGWYQRLIKRGVLPREKTGKGGGKKRE